MSVSAVDHTLTNIVLQSVMFFTSSLKIYLLISSLSTTSSEATYVYQAHRNSSRAKISADR